MIYRLYIDIRSMIDWWLSNDRSIVYKYRVMIDRWYIDNRLIIDQWYIDYISIIDRW